MVLMNNPRRYAVASFGGRHDSFPWHVISVLSRSWAEICGRLIMWCLLSVADQTSAEQLSRGASDG
jgi:hypothetical protein